MKTAYVRSADTVNNGNFSFHTALRSEYFALFCTVTIRFLVSGHQDLPYMKGEKSMEMKFYKCSICGQIAAIVEGTGVPLVCCGEEMEEMIPGSVDASVEKHVPVIEVMGDEVIVSIGSAPHPMTEGHHIAWVSLQTKFGNQRKELKANAEPAVCFRICEGDEVIAAYAFCNLHGLWKSDLIA